MRGSNRRYPGYSAPDASSCIAAVVGSVLACRLTCTKA